MQVTIDTNILIQACRDVSWTHITLLTRLKTKACTICLDSNGSMLSEYRHKLSGVEFFEKWYQENLNSFFWYNGTLPGRHVRYLSRLGCHEPPDHIIIAVAFHSGKILFTEDSDMGKGEKGNISPHDRALIYLEDQLGLQVCDCDEAIRLVG